MFALAQRLQFRAPPTLSAIVNAMAGGVIARGQLTGRYERP
jgi:hypothetical protein